MKKCFRFAAVAIVAGTMWTAPARADEHQQSFYPLELYTCNFNDGRSMADLDRVVERWNRHMDDQKALPYSAWTLVPYYNSPDYQFDVAWLGLWPSGEIMGQSLDQWMKAGGEMQAEFDRVVTCDGHANFAVMETKAPPNDEPADDFLLAFSDCSIEDGHNFEEVMASMGEWADYQESDGLEVGTWMFFPVFGGPDADYDFKAVESYESFPALGKAYDWYGQPAVFEKMGQLFEGKVDCNTSRMYRAQTRRFVAME